MLTKSSIAQNGVAEIKFAVEDIGLPQSDIYFRQITEDVAQRRVGSFIVSTGRRSAAMMATSSAVRLLPGLHRETSISEIFMVGTGPYRPKRDQGGF